MSGEPDHVAALFEQVRLLFHRLAEAVEELHRGEGVTAGMQAVLEWLLRAGPATVPQIARSRHVSRQHIQGLVNALRDRGLVVADENPAHRRSVLIALTPDGERVIRTMIDREHRHLARVDWAASGAEIVRATRTLARIREALDIGGHDGTAA